MLAFGWKATVKGIRNRYNFALKRDFLEFKSLASIQRTYPCSNSLCSRLLRACTSKAPAARARTVKSWWLNSFRDFPNSCQAAGKSFLSAQRNFFLSLPWRLFIGISPSNPSHDNFPSNSHAKAQPNELLQTLSRRVLFRVHEWFRLRLVSYQQFRSRNNRRVSVCKKHRMTAYVAEALVMTSQKKMKKSSSLAYECERTKIIG